MYGEVKSNSGVVFDKERYVVVKKEGDKGDTIPKHNHPEADVLFTVVDGKVEVTLNEEEKHELCSGKMLNFDGNNSISAVFKEKGQVFVTLIKK